MIRHTIQAKYLRYEPMFLKNPPLQLSGNIQNTYLSNVAIAQAVHLFQPKNFLEFGCYLGGLPLMVEDLLELANSDQQYKTNWYLFDNFSFLKELANLDKNYDEWITTPNAKLASWRDHVKHIRNPRSNGLLKSFAIPTTPAELTDLLMTASAKCNAPYPNIKLIANDFESISETKFDMILLDLSAENYLDNKKILETLVQNNLEPMGIMVLDDVVAWHQGQLLLFLDACTSIGLTLIAVAGDKIFLQRSSDMTTQDRNHWLMEIHNIRSSKENNGVDFFWHLWKDMGKYGHILKMVPNKTHFND